MNGMRGIKHHYGRTTSSLSQVRAYESTLRAVQTGMCGYSLGAEPNGKADRDRRKARARELTRLRELEMKGAK